jgi:hypothetical protein
MQSVPIITDVVSSNLDQGEVYNIIWKSLSVTCVRSVAFSNNKTDHNDIAEILLKVALEIIKQIGKQTNNATIDKNFVIQLFI